MIALVQRVNHAHVQIDSRQQAAIGPGLRALVCAEHGDATRQADLLADKALDRRIFEDGKQRMHSSFFDAGLASLAVPQCTLAADTDRGRRPSFAAAAAPELAGALFERLVVSARRQLKVVESGVFGAHMEVGLENDARATFWLRIAPRLEAPA